jgi:photoactive yellow protein
MSLIFTQPDLLAKLGEANAAELDTLSFGVVGMALDGVVTSYNTTESQLTGLTPRNVIGRHFFSHVAPCTNNFMVGYRFETEPMIDDVVDYVFTLRMQATKIRLRLMKQTGLSTMFLAVERR